MDSSPDHGEFEQAARARTEQLEACRSLMELAKSRMATTPPSSPNSTVMFQNRQVLRGLLPSEIKTLKSSCRCKSKDWSKICLLLSEHQSSADDQSHLLSSLVSETTFEGTVVLVLGTDDSSSLKLKQNQTYQQKPWSSLPLGVHSNIVIRDSVIHLTSSRVHRNSFISNTFVGPQSVLINCGLVDADKSATYTAIDIAVGPESGGGRDLHLTPEQTMVDVCRQLKLQGQQYESEATPKVPMNILCGSVVVRDTPTIQNVYLDRHSAIEGATSVKNVVLFPHASVGNSCTVSKALLQWNACISDHSSVSDVLIMEQGHAGPNSVIASSVIGPDVHVSAGEIHASVVGPNTNAHHQSLLIGVLWPLGRGNVGYGANVGSNHTGRLPDQETVAGEGTFWGLSCVVKFPVDLSHAPYCVVAAGTSVSPQRICMPFSLIVSHPSGNEIIPGWLLQSSPYTLTRSEKKFATRRKAKRHDFYTGWKIFRPETINMCRWARDQLRKEDASKIRGLGSNSLSKRGRDVGIQAYDDCIQRYALEGFLAWLLKLKESNNGFLGMEILRQNMSQLSRSRVDPVDPFAKVQWPLLPWESPYTEWQFQSSILMEEFPDKIGTPSGAAELLEKLVSLKHKLAKQIYKSKKRDDTRGAKTIPGYADSHVAAEKDPVIIEAREVAERTERQANELIGLLTGNVRSKL